MEDPFADSRLMARAGIALLLANVRYWTTVAPLVRAQLTRWERHAQAIGDPFLRTLAISKLHEERFNVEVAATLATLTPRAHRKRAAEAIVALQVMYDYLDLLTEQPLSDPLPDSRRLFAALIDALTLAKKPRGDYYPHDLRSLDDGYLEELVGATKDALARLPGAVAVTEVAQRSARRCAEAQTLSHVAARSSSAELERWARREATDTPLQWPEFLAGATASVLAMHALIAAAGNECTTPKDAEAIDAVYLSLGALTMLDSLVDLQEDIAAGELGYVQYYDSRELMAQRLVSVARDAAERARALPNAAHHIMTLVGVVTYYTSAPAASSAFALPVTEHMRRALRPLITPMLALMRAWRLAKRVRRA
jgi:tetraprenyl-beta-curcumene synthase